MKRFLIALLVSAISFSTVACSGESNGRKTIQVTSNTEKTTIETTHEMEEDIKLSDDDIDNISNDIQNKFKYTEYVSVFYNAIYKNYRIVVEYGYEFATSYNRFEYADNIISYCKEIQQKYKLKNTPTILIRLSLIDTKYNKNHKEIYWITSDYGESGTLCYKSDNVELTQIETPLTLLEERLKVTDYI